MPDIKDLLGEAYKEGMTSDEMIEALKGVSLPQDTTDELSRIKKSLDKATSEAAEYKRQLKARMSEEEQKRAEEAERFATIENENKELRKKISISESTSKFIASGLDPETALKCAEATYNGDIDTVISSFNEKMASIKDTVKAELIASTPQMKGGASTQVKDYSKDIESSLAIGDFALAAALTRKAQEQK